ncbi:Uncharacterised protein [Klebsiella variicola]|uniref:Uncharacterized protein n=1 Tax=Klebsiella variicola TaxID=244366 RepID=A0A7H4MR66_KLEVA|nr:Uncharacterised protein [Klebsiella variicola]VXZ81196.1 Uncharacterised protein [Klebsiella pneumoniae]
MELIYLNTRYINYFLIVMSKSILMHLMKLNLNLDLNLLMK